MLTPTEELKIATAYLETAEESFKRATTHLKHAQGHKATRKILLAKFQATFSHLQIQFSELEKRFQALTLPTDQSEKRDR